MSPEHEWPENREQLQLFLTEVTHQSKVNLFSLWESVQSRRQQGKPVDKLIARFKKQSHLAIENYQQRLAQKPEHIDFPESLPVSQRVDEISRLIDRHQVVIMAGETGSGKTTQLPKICLASGRGISGKIGHTQPRRIAASSVAQRIADELKVAIGGCVGYQVRFNDQSGDTSLIKLMTDGILLAEIQNDPLLLQYDTLIIDEAHERSLNIDFLLGYIKKILPQRPDLKVIVTSATIDLERFSEHFNQAPILEVSGRTYPVDIHYRPLSREQEDLGLAILETVEEILTLPKGPAGDILVFLAGERDIRETAHLLRKAQLQNLEILPLYSRLSIAEQRKVFSASSRRRIVLATNVAETSITVPGIGYVIDPGTARISRYSVRTKVQRLPIEPISQASASQRAGRCGRVSHGVCFRLYSEEDFLIRPEYTDPEIQRTNLASVVLQMLHLGIGDIRQFPFVDAPDKRLINDGYKLLEELEAVNRQGKLTAIGKRLAAIPVDPRLAKMLLVGVSNGALKEVLIIVAALAIQDPRERPVEKQQAADEKHRRFKDEDSDFLAYIKLWNYVEEQRQTYSQNQWRKQCGKEFLSYNRLREWRELHHQLRVSCKSGGLLENKDDASADAIHQSLLGGLLSYIGCRNEDTADMPYSGARNSKFALFPGSFLSKKKPKWIMAGELIETSKLFAHCVAKVDPQWILAASKHLQKHHYFEPHYVVKSGQVMGYDRVSLFGLVIVEKRPINYNHVDSKLAREVFIREALVEGKYPKNPRARGEFFRHNQDVIESVELLEAKSRRRDILVDDEIIFNFYNERVDSSVSNLSGFEHWRKTIEKEQPRLLYFSKEMLMQHDAAHISEVQFPNELNINGMSLPIFYHFSPGSSDDGVSIGIPAGILHSISESRLDWLVPGLLRDKCIALIKALPKQWRKLFVPVPHFVDQAMPRLEPGNQPLLEALQRELQRMLGRPLPDDLWQGVELDDFYKMNIKVMDQHNNMIDQGRDLDVLRQRYRGHVQDTLKSAGEELERSQVECWNFGELPESCQLVQAGVKVQAYPALVQEEGAIALRMLDHPIDARSSTKYALTKLIQLQMPQPIKYLQKELLKHKDIGLTLVNMGSRSNAVADIIDAAVFECAGLGEAIPRTQSEFEQCCKQTKSELIGSAQKFETVLIDVLSQVVEVRKRIKAVNKQVALVFTVSDVQEQINRLLFKGCLYKSGLTWFEQFPRYLSGIVLRLDKAPLDPRKDAQLTRSLQAYWEKHETRLQAEGVNAYRENDRWQLYRWMIEEYRISLFAQSLKTKMPVSDKRLEKAWQNSLG